MTAAPIARIAQWSERRWREACQAELQPPPQQALHLTRTAKTVGIIKKNIGIDPAVGFLVCVSGPHRGADYKLVSGRNFIGRAAAMDVALADDDTVSRESHALITYDVKHNTFSLSPGQGRGITYCNDEQVEMVRPLEAYDVIEVGKSRLLFLPLCGDRFKWDEE